MPVPPAGGCTIGTTSVRNTPMNAASPATRIVPCPTTNRAVRPNNTRPFLFYLPMLQSEGNFFLMLHINLIVLGKLKEKYWQESEAEYFKRLSAWAKVSIHEIKEESFNEKDPVEFIKQKEAEKITRALAKFLPRTGSRLGVGTDSYIIALDEHGQQFSSVDFAKKINRLAAEQDGNITFIIGGPLGLDESILKMAKLKLSLSAMTFTHQMARVFLSEQLYRAMTIILGKKYHY